MKKILLVGLSVLVLLNVFACSKGTEETKYILESAPLTVEYTFRHQGDEIIGFKYIQKLNYADQGIPKETIESQINLVKTRYNIPGVDYKSQITDTEMKEIIDVDVVVADKKKLQELGLMQTDDPNAKAMSLKKTVAGIESVGGKKVD